MHPTPVNRRHFVAALVAPLIGKPELLEQFASAAGKTRIAFDVRTPQVGVIDLSNSDPCLFFLPPGYRWVQLPATRRSCS